MKFEFWSIQVIEMGWKLTEKPPPPRIDPPLNVGRYAPVIPSFIIPKLIGGGGGSTISINNEVKNEIISHQFSDHRV